MMISSRRTTRNTKYSKKAHLRSKSSCSYNVPGSTMSMDMNMNTSYAEGSQGREICTIKRSFKIRHSLKFQNNRPTVFILQRMLSTIIFISLSTIRTTSITVEAFTPPSPNSNEMQDEKAQEIIIPKYSPLLETTNKIGAHSTQAQAPFFKPPTPHTGPIDDAKCNVEQLEEANDSQLFTILEDLKETSFFRNFVVDLDAKCPLSEWGKKKKDVVKSDGDTNEEKRDLETENDDEGCASEGLPDTEPDAEPACALNSNNNNMMPWQMDSPSSSDFGTTGFSSSSSSSSSSEISKTSSKSTHDEEKDKTATQSPNDNDKEEYECNGGNLADEMDESAPPLCELTGAEMDTLDLFNSSREQSTTPIQDLLSSALNAMNSKLGWDSKQQKDTFMWSNPSDPVIISSKDEGCDDELIDGELPDTFWLDMCASIKEGDQIKVVDLMLNPERNTGYNGTHIWRAIYEENCINLDGNADQPMCYEERVLYRLLSGLHASTTLSIAKNYYPPNKMKKRENWEPNPQYFYDQFHDHPEYIRNLHFSYVVLLRALKKASPVLHKYEIRTGNIVDDETATMLLKRLLDSSILTSCNGVFHAFDESLMFKTNNVASANGQDFKDPFTKGDEIVALQQNFKGVFHNISSILDCVQCQQCKLHGKMAMLGYGTALKILFTSKEELIASSLSRNEIVAFINTIAKMSEALMDIRELTHLYWNSEFEKSKSVSLPEPVNAAVGLAAALSRAGLISSEREFDLINAAMDNDEQLLDLAKQFSASLEKFASLSDSVGSADAEPDAIVVGTGLAGLSATLNILDRGGRVVVIEKEHRLGGNSNKASSGINACCPNNGTSDDYIDAFKTDTTKSAGDSAQLDLIQTLVENSADALNWLRERVGVDLSLIAQLGGHQYKRTHRPKNGMVGAEVIYGMQKAVRKFEQSGRVKIFIDTKVSDLIRDHNGRVVGVALEDLTGNNDKLPSRLNATSVILATGGFAADRGEQSYLASYRPELLQMSATAGSFSTGDGIKLAKSLGAGLVDMDKVQIHPTGWIDPKDPDNKNKILAAELMRGVGGVLINDEGERFCNELGTRAYVTNMMLSHDEYYAKHGVWNKVNKVPTFALVLSSSAASDGQKHVDHYLHKGLVTRIEGVEALANWMNQDVSQLRKTLLEYRQDADKGVDPWGKKSFQGLPNADLDSEVFYAGRVTPVLHYCMGGITINTEGNVLDEDNNIIEGLYAAGEVTGGVHGNNRLGGNSLLECTVFGTIVGKKVPIVPRVATKLHETKTLGNKLPPPQLKDVPMTELAKHNTEDDCWVAIYGKVYDLTSFAEEHPAGAESIYKLGGKDGTDAFQSVHNQAMMEDFEEVLIGNLVIDT